MGWEHTGDETVGFFDAVILDHDGTIVDSHDAMVRSYTRWAAEYDVDLTQMPKYMSMPSRALTEALVPDATRWDEAAARIEAHLGAQHETVFRIGRVTEGAHEVTIKGGVFDA